MHHKMRVLVFIGLFHTYACKEAISRPRAVNLALETIVEFNNNDTSADLQIIDKVRSFLDRVKVVIDKDKGYRRSFSNEDLTFSDFVKKVMAILRSYDDDDLEDVIAVANDEIRKYHYKGCKFYELVENINMRRYMADNLDKAKNVPAKAVKEGLRTMLNTFKEKNMDIFQKEVVDYVNSLYKNKSKKQFKSVLDRLSTYKSKSKRSNMDLVKIIRHGIRTLIFDHYSQLDFKIRQDLKSKLEIFWNYFIHPEKKQLFLWQFSTSSNTKRPYKDLLSDDDDSKSVEPIPVKHGKSKNKRHKPVKKLRRYKEDEFTTRRVPFVTLYPEPVTFLERQRHKAKATPKHRDHEKTRIRSRYRKPKAAKTIISKHEAVIQVGRGKGAEAVTAIVNDILKKSRFMPKPAVQHRSKTFKRFRAFDEESDTETPKKTKKRRYPTTKKFKQVEEQRSSFTEESDEGLAIKSFEHIPKSYRSFRKSNLNDTLVTNQLNHTAESKTEAASTVSLTDVNVLNKIKDLENQLRDVKAKMRVTNDKSIEDPPQYEPLEFWEGTTKKDDSNASTTETTTKITTTSKITTTTSKPKTTKTIAETTTAKITRKTTTVVKKPVSKVSSSTTAKVANATNNVIFEPVFRTDINKSVIMPPINENLLPDYDEGPIRNMSGVIPMSNAFMSDTLNMNNSAAEDYLTDIKYPDINITGIEGIEKYFNDTNPIEEDPKQTMVRKKMMEDIKGMMADNIEEINETALFLAKTTPSPGTTDMLNFLDVDEDVI